MIPKHSVRCEIDVEDSGPEWLADVAWRWLRGTVDRLEGDELGRALAVDDLPSDALRRPIPCGPPGASWGFFVMRTQGGTRETVKQRVLTQKNLKLFPKWLQNRFDQAELVLDVLDDKGYPGQRTLRVGVKRDYDAPQWLRFSVEAPEARFSSLEAQDRWVGLMRDFAAELGPSYAQIGYSYSDRTELERRLGPPAIGSKQALEESREFLRGYEWAMVVPRELAARLGPAAELSKEGGFSTVETLPDGALFVQVVPRFQDFTGDAAARTWSTLRPLLRPGMPRTLDADSRYPQSRVVYKDAAV